MKKLIFLLFAFSSFTLSAQLPVQKSEKWIFHDSVSVDDGLKVGYKSGSPATSIYYTRYNQLGRLTYYNDLTPSLGMLLKGNGTYYDNFAKGTARQYLRVNAAGTDLEWTKLKKADFDDLDAFELVFGNKTGNGQAEQDDLLTWEKYIDNALFLEANLDVAGGFYVYEDISTGTNFSKHGFGEFSVYSATGYTNVFPGYIVLSDDDILDATARTITLRKTDAGTNYTFSFPNNDGVTGQVLGNVDGLGTTDWVNAGTVSSFIFTDGSGFDGTVATATTTPTLSLTTTLSEYSVPFIGSLGALNEDNLNFAYDPVLIQLGIGLDQGSFAGLPANLTVQATSLINPAVMVKSVAAGQYIEAGQLGLNVECTGYVGTDIRGVNSNVLVTATQNGSYNYYANNSGTYNATAGGITAYGNYITMQGTRSAGVNDLTNIGLYSSSTGGQINYSALFDLGAVRLNTVANDNTQTRLMVWNSTDNTIQYRTLASLGFLSAEVDGNISNEGSLTVNAGTGTTSVISSNTSGSTDVTITAAGINAISEVGNVITLTATEVDGSTSNELQTLATTSDATSHTTTLSNSGGSQQLVEGTGITLTTSGTGLNGIATIATTALLAEVDGSITNEVQNLSYDAVNREVDISLSGTSATIPLGLDDGATEGLASFTAADFNVTAGNVAIDYANGQAATSGQDGLLQSTDWSIFDNKVYTLQITGTQGSFVDGTPYYSGAIVTGTSTTPAINRVPIPITGTLIAVYVFQYTSGTLSTGESSTIAIRYDNTTDVTVSSAVLNNAVSLEYNATGLSQAVVAGHYIEMKYTAAAWVTNPTNVRWTVILAIK